MAEEEAKGEIATKISSIVEICTVKDEGICAPATKSGTVVVGNVMCSCYAEHNKFTTHSIAHAALALLRWKETVLGKRKQTNAVQMEGLHKYCIFGIKVFEYCKVVNSL